MADLTKEQQEAVDVVSDWFYNSSKQYNALGGFAGCGKTFIIAHIIKALGLSANKVAICAYTGKATHNLQSKGVKAGTIHSLIYMPEEVENKETGEIEIYFRKMDHLEAPIELIIIDEASMVHEDIHKDLLSYNKKILYIGDCFQLPPIKAEDFNLMDDKHLCYKLTKVHRCVENSPIIRLSMDIRNGVNIDYHKGEFFSKIKASELTDKELLDYDQVLCGKNETRSTLNEYMRSRLGNSGLPRIFEKLIVLRNNPKFGVFNGQIVHLTSNAKKTGKQTLNMTYVDFYKIKKVDGVLNYIPMDERRHKFSIRNFAPFDKKETYSESHDKVMADFGYAITVHKAQGSEWDNVLLFDDGFGGWGEMRQRWLYTGVTRSRSSLLWVCV